MATLRGDRRTAADTRAFGDAIFAISQDLLVEVDAAGVVSRANPTWERLLGHSADEAAGQLFATFVHPDDRGIATAALEALRRGETLWGKEFRLLHADGSDRPFCWSWTTTSQGRALGSGHPLPEATAALSLRLQASEERLRIAQAAGGVGTFEWFPDTGEVFVSEQYCRLWGIEPRPVVMQQELLELILPEDRILSGPARMHRMKNPLDHAEFRVRRPDTGEIRWLSRRGEPVPSLDGGPVRLVGAVYDVTERRLAEQRLERVLEGVSDGFYGIDAHWRFTLFNKSAERFLGKSREEVIGRNIWEMFPDALGTDFEFYFRKVMEEHVAITFETESRAQPGCMVEMRAAPKEGGGIAVSFSDITERKRSERQRELLVAELNHRVKNTLAIVQGLAHQSFRGHGADVQARMRFEGRLAALSAAHEVLTRRNWESAGLRELVEHATAPFEPQGGAQRFHVDGPDLRLSPQTAVAFAMALHELCTNAAKYGALSTDGGRVTIDWHIARVGEEPRVRLLWRESGGPPVVAPDRRGFGSRMIERGLAAELRGTVRMDFHIDGLRCEIDAPLPAANRSGAET